MKFKAEDFPGSRKASFDRGEFVFLEGERSRDECFLIVKGRVEVLIEGMDGNETLLYCLDEGDLVGEMVFFGQAHRTATVRAVTAVEVLRISRERWTHYIDSRPESARVILEQLVSRFMSTHEVVRRLGQSRVPHRFGVYLLSLHEWKAHGDDVLEVKLPSVMEMSRMINCTRERLTRVIGEFIEHGAIRRGNERSIYIIDRLKVRSYILDI